MEAHIDAGFSLYDIIKRTDQNPNNIFTERTPILARWSKTIETEVLRRKIETDFFANFQKLDRFSHVFDRYSHMAQHASAIYIFGVPNAEYTPVANLHYVPLTTSDRLYREWFVLVNHPHYAQALVAQEITPDGLPFSERTYRGVLTGNRDIIAILDEWLRNSVSRTLPSLS